MTSYNHAASQEQDWKGNLVSWVPRAYKCWSWGYTRPAGKSVSWSEVKGLTCHQLSLPCPTAEQQNADDRRVTQFFPSIPAASGADDPSHQPAKPIAQLCWTLLGSSGAGWSRWRQDSCSSGQGRSFHFKGKISQRELHGPVPGSCCISHNCFPP